MSKGFQPGAMVYLLQARNRNCKHLEGAVKILGQRAPDCPFDGCGPYWRFDPPEYHHIGGELFWYQAAMRLLDDDQPETALVPDEEKVNA